MISASRSAEQTLKVLGTTAQLAFAPNNQLGVVSPCSQCKNHLTSLSDGDYLHTPCPRRLWIQTQNNQPTETYVPDQNVVIPPYLVESGTSSPDQLSNPVYSTTSSTMIIWVALAANNGDLYDATGNLVRNRIDGPGFDVDTDSEFLHCERLPYTPCDTQAQVYSKGVLHELDPIDVNTVANRQLDPSGNPQFIAGSVQKITQPFLFSITPATRDNNPAGC